MHVNDGDRAAQARMGGQFDEPLIGSAPMTSPIYNSSTPYTVTSQPKSMSRRQALDHYFTNG